MTERRVEKEDFQPVFFSTICFSLSHFNGPGMPCAGRAGPGSKLAVVCTRARRSGLRLSTCEMRLLRCDRDGEEQR